MTWILIDPLRIPEIRADLLFYHPDWIDDGNQKGIKLGYIEDKHIITTSWNLEECNYITNENDIIPYVYMEIPEFKT